MAAVRRDGDGGLLAGGERNGGQRREKESAPGATDVYAYEVTPSPSLGHAVTPCGFFIFIFLKMFFLQKYIFGFTFYSFIPLPPDRGRQGPIRK